MASGSFPQSVELCEKEWEPDTDSRKDCISQHVFLVFLSQLNLHWQLPVLRPVLRRQSCFELLTISVHLRSAISELYQESHQIRCTSLD